MLLNNQKSNVNTHTHVSLIGFKEIFVPIQSNFSIKLFFSLLCEKIVNQFKYMNDQQI